MRTVLIGPDSLEADAVVPQCLDNQYVSDRIFSEMIERGVDFRDETIAAQRENDFRTEFIRSLIYSSQVVIQRAFLNNSDFLFKNYLPESGENLTSFATLVRDKAIVPFLFNESSLSERDFLLNKDADRATQALLGAIGDEVTCVRLAVDDNSNKRATDIMATNFGAGLSRLKFLTGSQRNAMASELFADKGARLQEGGAWDAFDKSINDLASYAFNKPGKLGEDPNEKNKQLSRTHVYRDIFTVDAEDAIINGRFKRPGHDNPFLLELKKFVDLLYNTSLPDRLHRYTFTPANMPSRMALQDDPGVCHSNDQLHGVVSNPGVKESINRAFMAHSQRAMSLPLLRDLTVADVVEIRSLPEWDEFKNSQAMVLTILNEKPHEFVNQLETFQQNFELFQRALSDWYNRKYKRARIEEKYCSFVSLALSVGGKLIIAGSDLSPVVRAGATIIWENVANSIPRKVKGYAVKLMVNVFDMGKWELDADRTYSIELMQTNAELTREDVVALLNSISGKAGASIPSAVGQVADQGVQ